MSHHLSLLLLTQALAQSLAFTLAPIGTRAHARLSLFDGVAGTSDTLHATRSVCYASFYSKELATLILALTLTLPLTRTQTITLTVTLTLSARRANGALR